MFCNFPLIPHSEMLVVLKLFLQNIGVVVVAASVIPLILVPVVPLLLFFLYLRRFYLHTSRDVKRLESTSMFMQPCHNCSVCAEGFWIRLKPWAAEGKLRLMNDGLK